MNSRNITHAARETHENRSTEDIRHDIQQDEREISETVEEIGHRIGEKLDWRRYMQNSPYVTMGVAAGLGFVITRVLTRRRTPVERFMDSLAEGIKDSVGPMVSKKRHSDLVWATLAALGARLITGWIRTATETRKPASVLQSSAENLQTAANDT